MDCFVIMPIGNPETEFLWEQVYEPIIDSAGFKPRRIDEEDDGTLMPQQIIHYLNNSELLIADLTLARPNCYLEIGYAMGINKYNSLILCCREDHNPDSPKYVDNNHKVHFDIQSYGIIWWHKDNLDEFKTSLMAKIKKREIIKKSKLYKSKQSTVITASKVLKILSDSHEDLGKWKNRI